jgi:YidC/Oxa1 family membrane protein insertase
MSLLDPLSHALAAILAAVHTGLTSLGAVPSSAAVWLLCIAAVVFSVRLALLPLVAHGVRATRAAGRARPALTDLSERFRDRHDPESLRNYLDERRRISAEHRVSRFSFLPMLIQIPIWLALYQLISSVVAGHAVGAMGATLVASLGAAVLFGVRLTSRGYLAGGPAQLVVVLGLGLLAAMLSFVTQKYLVLPNLNISDQPTMVIRVQQLMPALSAVGLLVAAGAVPVALLAYWVINSAWTCAQSAVILRCFPTPGSPAATRRHPTFSDAGRSRPAGR